MLLHKISTLNEIDVDDITQEQINAINRPETEKQLYDTSKQVFDHLDSQRQSIFDNQPAIMASHTNDLGNAIEEGVKVGVKNGTITAEEGKKIIKDTNEHVININNLMQNGDVNPAQIQGNMSKLLSDVAKYGRESAQGAIRKVADSLSSIGKTLQNAKPNAENSSVAGGFFNKLSEMGNKIMRILPKNKDELLQPKTLMGIAAALGALGMATVAYKKIKKQRENRMES